MLCAKFPIENTDLPPYMSSMEMILSPEEAMKTALRQAQKAAEQGEVPVGAVVVQNKTKSGVAGEAAGGILVAQAHNEKEQRADAVAHAEILALQRACQKLGRWRLNDCSIYVTLEPCLMCCGAILSARLEATYYGTADPKFGAAHSLYECLEDPRQNHRCTVQSGLFAQESAQLLKEFFRQKRGGGKSKISPIKS